MLQLNKKIWTIKEIGLRETYSYDNGIAQCASSISSDRCVVNCLATNQAFDRHIESFKMLKGGLLPSPIIIPLSSTPLVAKNRIDSQTFIEIRSGLIDIFWLNIYSNIQMFQMHEFILQLMDLNLIHFEVVVHRPICIEERFDSV